MLFLQEYVSWCSFGHQRLYVLCQVCVHVCEFPLPATVHCTPKGLVSARLSKEFYCLISFRGRPLDGHSSTERN